MSTEKNLSALKLGQDLIELGLKVQRKEIPLKIVKDELNLQFVQSVIKETPEWEKDIESHDRILALMEIQGISKAELARRLDMTRQFVTDMLNGKKSITLKSAKKIAKALVVPLSGIISN